MDILQYKIILGSASKSRQKILREMGYEFEIMPSNIDEKAIRSEDPRELVIQLAYAKAESLFPRLQEPAILITSDQVILCNGKIREKPQSENEAREYLYMYAEYPPETVTSVVITNTGVKKQIEAVDVCKIIFSEIPESVIEEYIRNREAFTHAGGFGVEDPLFAPYIKEMQGEYESILGLPRKLTENLLNEIIK